MSSFERTESIVSRLSSLSLASLGVIKTRKGEVDWYSSHKWCVFKRGGGEGEVARRRGGEARWRGGEVGSARRRGGEVGNWRGEVKSSITFKLSLQSKN